MIWSVRYDFQADKFVLTSYLRGKQYTDYSYPLRPYEFACFLVGAYRLAQEKPVAVFINPSYAGSGVYTYIHDEIPVAQKKAVSPQDIEQAQELMYVQDGQVYVAGTTTLLSKVLALKQKGMSYLQLAEQFPAINPTVLYKIVQSQ